MGPDRDGGIGGLETHSFENGSASRLSRKTGAFYLAPVGSNFGIFGIEVLR